MCIRDRFNSNSKRDYKLEKNSRIDLWLDHFHSELKTKQLNSVLYDTDFEKENFDQNEINFRKNIVRELIISHIDVKYHSQVLNFEDPLEMLNHLNSLKSVRKIWTRLICAKR